MHIHTDTHSGRPYAHSCMHMQTHEHGHQPDGFTNAGISQHCHSTCHTMRTVCTSWPHANMVCTCQHNCTQRGPLEPIIPLPLLPFTPVSCYTTIIPPPPQVYLVGDPVQLPATVISGRALEQGYDVSLFKRLQVKGRVSG